MLSLVLSLLVLLAIILVAGAIILWRKGAPPGRIILVLIVAGMVIVNIAIWTVPDDSGDAPAEKLSGVGGAS